MMNADWPTYQNAPDLVAKANQVFTGEVTNISFQMLDMKTAQPVTEKTEEWNRSLYTIYTVEVDTLYKGSVKKNAQIRMSGGIQGRYVNEQLAVLGKDAEKGIPVMSERPEVVIGRTYLFVLYQYENTIPTPLNLDQGIFDLRNPFEEHPHMTAKDVISSFGQDKWDTFWTQWQKNNPNWETWLDKAAVE